MSKLTLDTLFNLGKAEGSIDAGQMIKPALARGLQLVGATTREFTTCLAYSFPNHYMQLTNTGKRLEKMQLLNEGSNQYKSKNRR